MSSSRARPPSRLGRSPSTHHRRLSGRGSTQMGFDRGGWYSYDQLDMGGAARSGSCPEYRAIEVGDIIPTSPTTGFVVRAVEPRRRVGPVQRHGDRPGPGGQPRPHGRSATRAGRPGGVGRLSGPDPQDFAASWAFVLEPLDGGRTRLIERFRVRFEGPAPTFRVIGPIMGFGVFVMVRRQLLGIKQRAEITAVAPPVERAGGQARTPCPRQRPIGRTGGRDGGRGRRSLTPEERVPHAPAGRSRPCRAGRVGLDAVGLAAMATDLEPPRPARRSRPRRSASRACRPRASGGSSTSRRRWTTSSAWASASPTSTRRGSSSRPASRACARAGPTTPATSGRSSCGGRLSRHLERPLRRPLRPGDRAPGHGRGVRGGRPGAARDVRPGRRGHPPRTVVRGVRPGHRLRRRRRRVTSRRASRTTSRSTRRRSRPRSRRGPRRCSWATRATRPGRSCPDDVADALADIAVRHDLLVYSDEIYDRLAYGTYRHRAMSALPGMRERTILMGGFSKAYAMTGWRVGYVAAPAGILEGMRQGPPVRDHVGADDGPGRRARGDRRGRGRRRADAEPSTTGAAG